MKYVVSICMTLNCYMYEYKHDPELYHVVRLHSKYNPELCYMYMYMYNLKLCFEYKSNTEHFVMSVHCTYTP